MRPAAIRGDRCRTDCPARAVSSSLRANHSGRWNSHHLADHRGSTAKRLELRRWSWARLRRYGDVTVAGLRSERRCHRLGSTDRPSPWHRPPPQRSPRMFITHHRHSRANLLRRHLYCLSRRGHHVAIPVEPAPRQPNRRHPYVASQPSRATSNGYGVHCLSPTFSPAGLYRVTRTERQFPSPLDGLPTRHRPRGTAHHVRHTGRGGSASALRRDAPEAIQPGRLRVIKATHCGELSARDKNRYQMGSRQVTLSSPGAPRRRGPWRR